jgi:hypothetical protein
MFRINAAARKVSIFLTVDSESIIKYFNSNDPAPLYCRQLSHEFQGYLNASIAFVRRNTVLPYFFTQPFTCLPSSAGIYLFKLSNEKIMFRKELLIRK